MSSALSLQELDAEFSELLPEREALAALGGQFNFHHFHHHHHHVPKPCEPKHHPCPPVKPPCPPPCHEKPVLPHKW